MEDLRTSTIGVLRSTYEFTFSLSSSPPFWTVLSVNSSKLTNSDSELQKSPEVNYKKIDESDELLSEDLKLENE